MRNKYQRKQRKSNPQKFEVVGGQELMMRVPLPMAEVWAEMQAQVEELTGQAGLQILRAILENEVTRRVVASASPKSYMRRLQCAGESSRVMWFLVDRKFRWNGRGCERGKARKWSWRATVSCSKTESCNERCGNAWWRVCPRGTIGER